MGYFWGSKNFSGNTFFSWRDNLSSVMRCMQLPILQSTTKTSPRVQATQFSVVPRPAWFQTQSQFVRSLHLFQHDSLGVRSTLEGLLPLVSKMALLVSLVCPKLSSAMVLELAPGSNSARLTARNRGHPQINPPPCSSHIKDAKQFKHISVDIRSSRTTGNTLTPCLQEESCSAVRKRKKFPSSRSCKANRGIKTKYYYYELGNFRDGLRNLRRAKVK
jgi:hypothetical protein